VILDRQDELRCLEENLEEIDLEDHGTSRKTSRKDDLDHADSLGKGLGARARLVQTIRKKLVNYGEILPPTQATNAQSLVDKLLVKARELNAFQRPSKRDYRSFRTWFWNKNPLRYELEEQFIKRKEDLISLRHGREWSGFDGFIESCVRKMHCRLTQVQCLSYSPTSLTRFAEPLRYQRTTRKD
jgi:hypothetical protein